MNPCNFCGNAVVYHLDGGRNRCPRCGNGDPAEEERDRLMKTIRAASMCTTDADEMFQRASMCDNAYRDQHGVAHIQVPSFPSSVNTPGIMAVGKNMDEIERRIESKLDEKRPWWRFI